MSHNWGCPMKYVEKERNKSYALEKCIVWIHVPMSK